MNVIRDRRHELTPLDSCPPDPSVPQGLAAPPALRPGAEPHSLVGSDPVAVLPGFRCSWAILNAAARRWIRAAALAGQRPHRPAVPLRILYRYHQHDPRGAERGRASCWRSPTGAAVRCSAKKSAWRWPMPKPPPRRRRRWMMPCAARWPRILTPGRSPLTALIGLQNLSARVQCRDGDPGSGVVPDTHLFLAE